MLALVPLPRDWCHIAYVPPTNAQIMVLKAKVAAKAPVVKASVVKKKAPAASEEKACKAGCKWCEKGECWVSGQIEKPASKPKGKGKGRSNYQGGGSWGGNYGGDSGGALELVAALLGGGGGGWIRTSPHIFFE